MFYGFLIGVAVGVAALIAVFVLARRAHRVPLDSKDDVLEKWHGFFPDHAATNVILQPSGIAALLDLDDGGTGILWITKGKPAARVLKAGRLRQSGPQLRIEIPDFKSAEITLELEQPMVRRIWVETLKTVLVETP